MLRKIMGNQLKVIQLIFRNAYNGRPCNILLLLYLFSNNEIQLVLEYLRIISVLNLYFILIIILICE